MYTIGYDIGSSSIKAALVEISSGKSINVVTEPSTEMSMKALRHGWAEQNPNDWWLHICNATKQLLAANNISKNQVSGIGISYQMHGLVLVNTNGNPLRDSIIWCDSRAVEIGKQAYNDIGKEKCDEHLLNAPGNFTASKLKWVKDNEPQIYSQIYKFMLPGDYIAYKLSNTINSTVSGLSEGIFWDFKTNQIADWFLDHYGIDPKMVPDIVDTFSVQGKISQEGAIATGLNKDTPILYRAGDQPNNALSLNVFNPGEVAATGGTSGVVYAITENLSVKESSRVNNFAHVNYKHSQPRIGKLLCINGAGIQYRWLLNNLNVTSYQEMNDLANSVAIGSEEVMIHPFGNGAERMLDNKTIGTQISNLNLNIHTKAHLCRAALEGIAFSFVYGMEIMKSDELQVNVIRAGNDNLFRSSIFSNTIATLIGHEIEIYDTTGAIGAARACQLYKGDFESFGKQIIENDYVTGFKPAIEKTAYEKAYTQWKNKLTHLLNTN